MISIDFWKTWSLPCRWVFFTLVTSWFVCWSALVFFNYTGWETAYPWISKNTAEETKVIIEQIKFGFITVPLEGNMYYMNEQLIKALPDFDTLFHSAIVLVWLVCIALVTTSFSYLKSWWYIIGLFALSISWLGLKWEASLPLQYGDWLSYALIALLTGIHIVIHVKKLLPRYHQRLLLFLVLYILVYTLLFVLGETPSLVLLGNYGLYVPVVFSLVFLVMTGFDLIYFFLYINTNLKGVEKGANFTNYFIISTLYLGNVIIALLNKRGIMSFSFIAIPEWLVLGLITVIGFFVHERRNKATGDTLDYSPFGALFFGSLGLITCATLLYGYISGCDTLVKTINIGILYTQAFIGTLFFFYTLSKFGKYIRMDLRVYEIVFKAVRFPIQLIRLGGMIGITALVSYFGQRELGWIYSAYFSQVGYSYYSLGDKNMAREYLKESAFQSNSSYQAHFGLATIYFEEGNLDASAETYNRMLYLHQYEGIYANLAYSTDNPFGAMEYLRLGISKLKNPSVLMNNLGVTFSKTHLIDSSYYYYNLALKNGLSDKQYKTNVLHLLIKKRIQTDDDELVNSQSSYAPLETNRLCYGKLFNKVLETPDLSKGKIKSGQEQMLYNNLIMYEMNPSPLVYKKLDEVIQQDSLGVFYSDLLYTKSLLYLKENKLNQAMLELNKLQFETPSKANIYLYTLGLISLKNHYYSLAEEYFNQSFNFENRIALAMLAISKAMKGEWESSKETWLILNRSPDSFERELSSAFLKIIDEQPGIDSPLFPLWLVSHEEKLTIDQINQHLNKINDQELKHEASLMLLGKWSTSAEWARFKKLQIDKSLEDAPLYMLNMLPSLDSKKIESISQSTSLPKPLKDLSVIQLKINSNDTTGINLGLDSLRNYYLFEKTYLDMATTFYKKQGQIGKAYELSKEAIYANPYHIEALQLFTFLALESHLEDFAIDGKKKLEKLMKPMAYKDFETRFEAKRAETSKIPGWE